jgi:Fe-S-cluster-containing dehydrogenase component
MSKKLAMVIDSAVCIDCKACMVACKVENKVPEGYWRNWVKQQMPFPEAVIDDPKSARLHFQPGNCMHCDEATCVQACPTGATYRNPADNTIQVDKKLCIGCGSCIPACPYGARYRHPEQRVVDKCDFCAARRQRGEAPACVVTCPTKARVFGDLNDPVSDATRLLKTKTTVRVVGSYTDTRPNLYYLSFTAPMDWPGKAKTPAAIGLLKSLFLPVSGVAGITLLAVLVMIGRQVLGKDGDADDKEEHHD